MINKRLISLLGDSKRYIGGNVACQWGMLLCNIVIVSIVGGVVAAQLGEGTPGIGLPWLMGLLFCVALRHILCVGSPDERIGIAVGQAYTAGASL